jgi:hypothetical protein
MREGERGAEVFARRSLLSPGQRILTEERGLDKHLTRLNITSSLQVVIGEEKSLRYPTVPNDFAMGILESR